MELKARLFDMYKPVIDTIDPAIIKEIIKKA